MCLGTNIKIINLQVYQYILAAIHKTTAHQINNIGLSGVLKSYHIVHETDILDLVGGQSKNPSKQNVRHSVKLHPELDQKSNLVFTTF